MRETLLQRMLVVEEIAELAAATAQSAIVGAGNTPVLVYRPGGVTAGNVYATQAALDVAISKTSGPVFVQIDDSIVTPAVLTTPSVPWRPVNVVDVELLGFSPGGFAGFPQLSITGHLPAVSVYDTLSITYSVTPFVAAAAQNAVFYLKNCLVAASGPGIPFIDATAAGAFVDVLMFATSVNGPEFAVVSAATLACEFIMNGLTSIANNCLVGPAAQFVVIADPGTAFNVWAQSGVTGGPIAITYQGTPAQFLPNYVIRKAAAQAGVASPAGQIVGGAVSTNAPFGTATITKQTTVPGRIRVNCSLEVTTSAAATVTLIITARTAGAGNFAAEYTTQTAVGAAGPVTIATGDLIFDGGILGQLPATAAGAIDVGVEVTVSAGTITTVANHGFLKVEEF